MSAAVVLSGLQKERQLPRRHSVQQRHRPRIELRKCELPVARSAKFRGVERKRRLPRQGVYRSRISPDVSPGGVPILSGVDHVARQLRDRIPAAPACQWEVHPCCLALRFADIGRPSSKFGELRLRGRVQHLNALSGLKTGLRGSFALMTSFRAVIATR
jgi:hypothetical protein